MSLRNLPLQLYKSVTLYNNAYMKFNCIIDFFPTVTLYIFFWGVRGVLGVGSFFVFSYLNLYYRAQPGLSGSLDHWAFKDSQGNKALEGRREREDQVEKRSISSINYYFLIIILKSVY